MPPPPTAPPSPLLPRGAVLRLGFAATLVAALLYLVLFWQPTTPIDPTDLALPEPPLIAVPQIDNHLLEQARDSTREQRLFLEAEPLSHLLAQSLNVSDDAGQALGMPDQMVSIEELQDSPGAWRGRWLFYRGTVEELTGPRPGNPVPGYGIYEATLRLRDGGRVLFAFSRPPGEGVHVGGWARAEGYLLKLRDVTFPIELQKVPLLVGASLREDYADWQPVTALDPDKLSQVIDVQRDGDRIEVSSDSWRTIDEDQSLALWHLGAYARDAAPRTLAQWRQVPALASQDILDQFRRNEVERGTPLRVMGMLVTSRTIRAQPNPAGIERWTEAWVQVRDLGGRTIPVWVPKATNQPIGSSLEVRGYYYRRYSYETRRGVQLWTPLFVAADLDLFVFDPSTGIKEVGVWALGGMVVLLLLAFWGQRRERLRTQRHEDAMSARRRQRRTKLATSAVGDGP